MYKKELNQYIETSGGASMNIFLTIILVSMVLILIWAFLGITSEEKVADTRSDDESKPEKILRRRAADREIEEQFPDDEPRRRRKSDYVPEETQQEPDQAFELPHLADEIISDTSRFRIYKRTLKNSEIYALKGDFTTAISLYAGVHERVNDLETRYKIESNIEYLRNYRNKKREIAHRKKHDPLKKPGEVKFTVDGNMPERINIGVIDHEKIINTDHIAEKVISQLKQDLKSDDRISRELDEIKSIKDDLKSFTALKDDISQLNSKIEGLSKNIIPESDGLPSASSAKYAQPAPLTIDPKPILDLLQQIPGTMKKKDGDSSSPGAKGPTSGAKQSGTALDEESDSDFELISEYGREKGGDELSDEEIFEKILQDTRDESDTSSFEILGDRREDQEFDILDKDHENKMKEEENFYRNLIKTDRRKKKELPILKVSYDFNRLPDEFSLSREQNILEYSFYKYKPLLEKAAEFIKQRKVRDAINYYKVVQSQNIPPEFKAMIRKNIRDLTEYLEKYLASD
jgi:hypothetical protein